MFKESFKTALHGAVRSQLVKSHAFLCVSISRIKVKTAIEGLAIDENFSLYEITVYKIHEPR